MVIDRVVKMRRKITWHNDDGVFGCVSHRGHGEAHPLLAALLLHCLHTAHDVDFGIFLQRQ